jgi:hypothetical protein
MVVNFIIPILIFAGLFFLVYFLTSKNILNNNVFVRIRILLGCTYIGFLASEITRGTSTRSVITMICLAAIIVYGVFRLQKKYFIIKNSDQ